MRPTYNGLLLGDWARDIIIDPETGEAKGRGPEPDNRTIDTDLRINDFAPGERVLAWWHGLWWEAVVHHVGVNYLALRWVHSRKVTRGYLPRLVCHMD